MNLQRPIALAALSLCLLAVGCGESQQDQSPEHPQQGRTSAQAPTPTTPTAPSTGTQPGTAPSTTEETHASESTSPGGQPAFVEAQKKSPEGLAGAEAVVRSHGFTPVETSSYKASQTLRVLVGSGPGGRAAFFFVGDRLIGTDAATPSTSVTVVSQSEGSVTLRYALYSSGRPAGSANVTFQLENEMLQPRQAVPPASARTNR